MKLLTLLWKIWYLLLNLISIIIIAPLVIILSYFNNTYNAIYFLIRLWANFVFFGIGMRYRLHSLEQLNRDQAYIIISNHTSVMDVMLMIVLHPKHPLAFVGKKELEKIPLFGTAYKKVCVMVDRKSVKSKAEVYRRSLEKIKQGRSMVIFPEGGVTEDERDLLMPFKNGAFAIAKMSGTPIVAYTFVGMKKAFPFNFWRGMPLKIQVYRESVFGKSEVSKKTEKELNEESKDMILKRLKKAQSSS